MALLHRLRASARTAEGSALPSAAPVRRVPPNSSHGGPAASGFLRTMRRSQSRSASPLGRFGFTLREPTPARAGNGGSRSCMSRCRRPRRPRRPRGSRSARGHRSRAGCRRWWARPTKRPSARPMPSLIASWRAWGSAARSPRSARRGSSRRALHRSVDCPRRRNHSATRARSERRRRSSGRATTSTSRRSWPRAGPPRPRRSPSTSTGSSGSSRPG